MAIPNPQQLVVEIQVYGIVAAAGGRQIPQRNIFHYRRTTTVNPLSKVNFNTVFQAGPGAAMAAAFNVRWAAAFNYIRIVNDAQDAFTGIVNANVGAIATDSYDSRSAVYMQLKSGARGRPFNGSKHFGPLSEVDTTGDVLTGAGLARWQALQAACLATLGPDASGNTWVPVILSGPPWSYLLTNPTTVYTNDVIAVLLNKAVGSMKKRRCGPVY
jgi:hypothetical protein